jgi:hypothetical protein
MSDAITFRDLAPGDHDGGHCAMCGWPAGRWEACVRAADHLVTGPIVVLLHPACRAEVVLPPPTSAP